MVKKEKIDRVRKRKKKMGGGREKKEIDGGWAAGKRKTDSGWG